MRAPKFAMMTITVPTMRAAVLAMLRTYHPGPAAAHPTTVDTAGLTDGGLLDAIAPNLANVLADTLTGVLETIGYGYTVFLGLASAAAVCRVCRELALRWKNREARIAEEALRCHAGAVR